MTQNGEKRPYHYHSQETQHNSLANLRRGRIALQEQRQNKTSPDTFTKGVDYPYSIGLLSHCLRLLSEQSGHGVKFAPRVKGHYGITYQGKAYNFQTLPEVYAWVNGQGINVQAEYERAKARIERKKLTNGHEHAQESNLTVKIPADDVLNTLAAAEMNGKPAELTLAIKLRIQVEMETI